MNFKDLLSKTKTALATIGDKVVETAGKATHVVVDVADDVKDGFLDFTNLRSVRDRLTDTLLEATKDGSLSAEELAEFKELQSKLQISDPEMKDIKVSVLKEVIKRATADGKVTAEEMKLIEELQKDLEIPTDGLQDDLAKVKAMFSA